MADEYEPLREAVKGTPVKVEFQTWSQNGVQKYGTAPHGDIDAGMAAYERVAASALACGDSTVFVWLRADGSTVPHIIVDASKAQNNKRTVRWWLERVAEANAFCDDKLPKDVVPLVRRLLSEHDQRAAGLRSYESPSGWLSGRSV